MNAPSPLERYLDKRAQKREAGEQYQRYARWSGRALEVPVSVVAGLLLGRYLGGFLGYTQVGAFVGGVLGLITAIRALIRLVRAYQTEEDQPQEDQPQQEQPHA